MFSFLNEIDKYIKENKIPLKRILFSYTYLPNYINHAILYEIRRFTDDFELGCSTYELMYDKNGNLCLLVRDSANRKKIAFAMDEKTISLGFKVVKRSEKRLIKDACMLRYYDEYRLRIRKAINKDYGDYPEIEKIKCEYRLMYQLICKKYREEPEFYHGIINKVDYITPLMDSVEKITSYIDYVYDISTIKPEPVVKKETRQGISYREPEKEVLIERSAPNFTFGPNKDRINDVIATDLRFSVLESLPYVYRDYAYNVFNKEINYMAYMYHIDSDRYIIVMEPYNGTKYTKIVGITDSEEMTKEKFDSYVKHYLELSKHKTLNSDNIVRISHTSFSQYERKIKYAIACLQDELCSNYFKTKIRKLREH